ncbi:MAG: DUF4065 domain-containing protein [Flavobacteriales bacterium]
MPDKQPTTVNIKELAEYLIARFQAEGVPITPVKLQKLLYYIQAWHLVYEKGHPLFNDQPEAWVNGPVYKAVFPLYKNRFMYDSIVLAGVKDDAEARAAMEKKFAALKLNQEQAGLLESVIQAYGFLENEKLILLSHSEKPWLEARVGLGPLEKSAKPISHDTMRAFYGARVKK